MFLKNVGNTFFSFNLFLFLDNFFEEHKISFFLDFSIVFLQRNSFHWLSSNNILETS